LKFVTPGGRVVYGGGGITPDIFVPLDSTYLNAILGELTYAGIIRQYSFNYIDVKRKEFEKYKDGKEFVKKFQVSDVMVTELLGMAKAEGIAVTSANQKKLSAELKNRVKAQLARHLYDDNTMYQVLLESDKDFKKAMEVSKGSVKIAQNKH
jgi:carboxyl-terminal processing protease